MKQLIAQFVKDRKELVKKVQQVSQHAVKAKKAMWEAEGRVE